MHAARCRLSAWLPCVLVAVRAGAMATLDPGSLATFFASPFDPNRDGVLDSTVATVAPGWSTANLPRLVNHEIGSNMNYTNMPRFTLGGASGPPGPATYVELTRTAGGSFPVGTVIAAQDVWSGFSGAMPFAVKLADGPAAWGSVSPAASGAGTPGTAPLFFNSFAPVSADRVRLEYAQSALYGGTGYADFSGALLLPDQTVRLLPVAYSGTTPTWGSYSNLSDDGFHNGVAIDNTTADKHFQFDLGEAQEIGGLVLLNYENHPSVKVEIRLSNVSDDLGVAPVATVNLTGSNYADWAAIRLNTPQTGRYLRFDLPNADADHFALREIYVLQIVPVPEPGAMALLTGAVLFAGAGRRPARAPRASRLQTA